MSFLKRTVAVLLVLCVSVVVAFLWRVRSRSVLLRDGSELSLAKVTHGKANKFFYGDPWRVALRHILPSEGRQILGYWLTGPNHAFTYSSSNVVSCWFLVKPPPPPQVWASNNTFRVVCTDEDGKVQNGRIDYLGGWTGGIPNPPLYPFLYQFSPLASSSRLKLVVFQKSNSADWTEVAQFKIKNPIPKQRGR